MSDFGAAFPPPPSAAPAIKAPSAKKKRTVPTWVAAVTLVIGGGAGYAAGHSLSDDSGEKQAGSSSATTTLPVPATTEADTPADSTGDTSTESTVQVPPSEDGTRDDPVPLGVSAEVGAGWSVTVDEVNLDAAGEIMAANEYNDPPAAGNVFVLIDVTVTYNGADTSSTDGVNFSVVGASNVAVDSSWATPPRESYNSSAELFQGGSVSGQIVFEVPAADAPSLVLIGRAYFVYEDSDRAFFALS